MPEHVHLLLWPPADKISPDPNSTQGRIRGILASIKQPVAEKAIQYLQEHSPEFLSRLRVHNRDRSYHRFWQAGSGYDQNVSEARALHELTEYIHLNPVRRGLVNRPEDWIWSSARDWNRLSGQLIKVDRTLPDTIGIPWLIRNSDRN
jgi:putative transposase